MAIVTSHMNKKKNHLQISTIIDGMWIDGQRMNISIIHEYLCILSTFLIGTKSFNIP